MAFVTLPRTAVELKVCVGRLLLAGLSDAEFRVDRYGVLALAQKKLLGWL
jgi:hypothetical protein